jgi:hypothetical protein
VCRKFARSIFESIDRLYRALRKLWQLQKQIREKQKRNLEHKTEAKQQKKKMKKIYLTSRKTKSIKQKPIFEPISPATAPKTCCKFKRVLASARIVCNIAFCKCEVDLIGKWSKVSVLLNQPHSNLVPRV